MKIVPPVYDRRPILSIVDRLRVIAIVNSDQVREGLNPVAIAFLGQES